MEGGNVVKTSEWHSIIRFVTVYASQSMQHTPDVPIASLLMLESAYVDRTSDMYDIMGHALQYRPDFNQCMSQMRCLQEEAKLQRFEGHTCGGSICQTSMNETFVGMMGVHC